MSTSRSLARRARRALLPLATLATIASAHAATGAPASCPAPARRAADSLVARARAAYRGGAATRADSLYGAALARCPGDPTARSGAGYARLQGGDAAGARALFELVLAAHPRDYDALAGAGMAAYRTGDLVAGRRFFERALRASPGDSTARWYLARLPELVDSSALPRRVRPETTVVSARAGRGVLEVPDGRGGWRPLWIKGVNVGAALPGRHPSEFPADDGTYEGWIRAAAELNANVLRVYTIHPPHFYRALERWNRAHSAAPIWLVHGVWTEPPPGRLEERYDDAAWNAAFRAEMRRVVDLLHGRAAIPARAGHAYGLYTADVSRWTLAYIIGREWEPYSVGEYARLHPERTAYAGRYLGVERGNAVEAWVAEACDALVAYEMDAYNAQRPVAYTNWPTLDPLHHPTETTRAEEDSLYRLRGMAPAEASQEYDNDGVGLDATRMRATAAYRAGTFASFHAYPYYPDFMVLDSAYARSRSPGGASAYFGYLRELVAHHGDMPVVISEYGVPSSRGNAHRQPQGWDHGGHSEVAQGEIDARLTRDIHAAGAAGGVVFALIDEWFKKNWLVVDFEQPLERNRLWLNALDAEQNYGLIAMRAGRADSALRVDGDGREWGARGRWYEAPRADTSLPAPLRLRALRVTSDPAYVYLRLDVGAIDWARGRYLIGIDTYRPELGGTRLPYTGATSPVGLEFVLDLHGPEGSHLLVDRPYSLYRDVPVAGSGDLMSIYNRPFRSVPNAAGLWDTLWVETNRQRLGRDGTVFPRVRLDRNRLVHARQQETSLADWYADAATGTIEVRIPWGMLHVMDPSSRTVLHGSSPQARDPEGATTDGFRFVVQSYDPAHPARGGDVLPRAATGADVAAGRGARFASVLPTWTWRTWETPSWHAERKPSFDAMRRAFGAIDERARGAAPAVSAGR